jgi:MFS family permease
MSTTDVLITGNDFTQAEIKKIQEIYDKYGYGRTNFKFIAVTFLVIMCYGIHLSIYAIMLLPMNKAYELTPLEQKFASSIVFLGLAIGSVLLGLIKEAKKHRKLVLISFTLLLTICHVIISFIFNPIIFIIVRFVIGACIGIMLPSSYSLLVEYLPLKMRSFVLSLVWMSYPISRICLACCMLVVMPNLEDDQTQTVMLINLAIPVGTLLACIFLVKDSPRNLIVVGKHDEAFEILNGMLGRDLAEGEKENIRNEINQGINQQLNGSFKDMFSSKLLRSTICLTVIWCVHGLIFYGTLLTSSLTIKQLGLGAKTTHDIIIGQIIIALELIPVMVVIGLLTEFKVLGRTKTYFLTYTLGAIFMLLCGLVSSEFAILYGLATSFMGSGNNISNSYASEIYPTKIREAALSFLYFTSRVTTAITQAVFLYVVETYPDISLIPYYLSSGLLVTLLIAILLLPFETHSKAIDQDLGKANDVIPDDKI